MGWAPSPLPPPEPPPPLPPPSPTLCVVDDSGSHVTSPKGGVGCEADLIAVGHAEVSQDVLQQLSLLHMPNRDGLNHGVVLVQLWIQGCSQMTRKATPSTGGGAQALKCFRRAEGAKVWDNRSVVSSSLRWHTLQFRALSQGCLYANNHT